MDILAGKCENGGSEVRSKFSSRYTSEADLQKLSYALRILSETEKQLRVPKNQTTRFIAALLQLSSSSTVKLCRLSFHRCRWYRVVFERCMQWRERAWRILLQVGVKANHTD